MQTILADLQNNIPLVLVAVLAGLIIGCLLTGIIMAIRGRSKLSQQQTSLEDEFNQKQQLFTEKEQQLEAENTKNTEFKQQLETQLAEKDNHIEQIEKQLQQSTKEVTERIPKLVHHIKTRNQQLHELLTRLEKNLELTDQPVPDEKDIWAEVLWQRHDEVTSQAIERLSKEAQIQTELKQANEQTIAKLTEKESAIQNLENKITEHVSGMSKLEADLVSQNKNIEQLRLKENEIIISHEENLKQNLSRINELESERTELDKKLSSVQQQSTLFEQKTKELNLQIEQNTAEQQTTNLNTQENQDLLAQIDNNNSQLKEKLLTLETDFKLEASTQQGDSLWEQYDELMSQLAKRIQTLEAYITIEQDSTEETEMPEAEDTREEAELADNTTQNEAAPEAVEETEKHEEISNVKVDVVDNIKQQLDDHLLNPVKEQIDATTEKAKKVPTYFKDLFTQKIKSLKSKK